MARCHRIGQAKPVLVFRLLTTGSVEIDMMEKQVCRMTIAKVGRLSGERMKHASLYEPFARLHRNIPLYSQVICLRDVFDVTLEKG